VVGTPHRGFTLRRSIPWAILAGLSAPAKAPAVHERNLRHLPNLAGWTVVNTPNGTGAPGLVGTIDIDGPGGLNAGPRREV